MNLPNEMDNFDFTITNLHYVVDLLSKSSVNVQPTQESVSQNEYVLSLTTHGSTNYYISDNHYSISKGDILFFPKVLPRKKILGESDQWRHIIVRFNVQFGGDADQAALESLNPVFKNIDQTRSGLLFQELLQAWVGKQTGYWIRCRSRIMDILHLLIIDSLEHKTSHLKMVELLLGLMHANEQNFFSIAELSREIGISPSYLCLIFKKTTGMTVIQYQNRIKIGKASDLLRSGEYNITAVAERLGFKDIYYFSRLFKKMMGTPPSYIMKKL
ncbi:AraC family transcriptional regulator [Paenibacillus hemerocallicola]|uniref:AraC family transcriptional regulator n=1 Tax=Paenibacillus hemerocallicola TaxID=1172614 RepID=A0A5C4SYE5_9BACL|nr:AraC family transcriptional regulator [Paenibacillus hemerocallicola]TNJ61013.1 AraC family transcriptional regulator [Paenibacillus hemerocallicola]